MIVRWATGAALLLIGAGGCSNGVVVHSDIAHAIDVQSQLAYATAGHQMKTRILGNPFDVPEDTFVTVVTTTMRGANPGVPVTFSTDPTANTRKPYHVVVQFNPPVSLGGEELCGGASQSSDGSSSGNFRVVTAFCYGDEVLSEAQAEAANVAGPSDPRFRFMIQQVILFLFPPDEPDRLDQASGPDNPPPPPTSRT